MEVRDDNGDIIPPQFLTFRERHGLDDPRYTGWFLLLFSAVLATVLGAMNVAFAGSSTDTVTGFVLLIAAGCLLVLSRLAHRYEQHRADHRIRRYQEWKHGRPPAK